MLKKLGKDVIIYGLASSISRFIGLFLLPFYTAYFSKEQFGSLDLISTVISFVAILGMLQLESAISRYFYEVEGKKRKQFISTGFWTIISLSLLLVIITFLLSNTISYLLFNTIKYSSIIKIATLNILFFNIFGYLTVLIRFKKKPLIYSSIVFIQLLTTAIVSVVLIIYYNYGIIAFFIGQVSGAFVGVCILFFYLRNNFILHFKYKILKDFLSYSLPMLPAVAGNWLNSYVNRFVMLGYLSIGEIGVYAVALKIASIFKLIDNAFRMAWGPFIWEQVKNNDYKLLLRKFSIIITVIVLLLSILFSLFTEEAVLILSTTEYLKAAKIIKILVFAFAFPIITQVIGIGTSIAKKTIYNTISFFIGVSVNIVLLFIIVPAFGLIGVPISLLISNIVIFVLMWYFAEKSHKINYSIGNVVMVVMTSFFLIGLLVLFSISLLYKTLILVVILMFLLIFYNSIKLYFIKLFSK